MNDVLSLEERVLESIMAPSQPPKARRQQKTFKPDKGPPAIPMPLGMKAVAKGQQALMKEKWLNGWRSLTDLTSGIEQSDPRFNPLINVLEQADTAFERENWKEFQMAASRIKNIANKGGLKP